MTSYNRECSSGLDTHGGSQPIVLSSNYCGVDQVEGRVLHLEAIVLVEPAQQWTG